MARSTSTEALNALLEKTSHYDKDERYMATSDLCAALSTEIRIDEVMEARICSAVLKQLDDKSNDVQSVAVKCLGTILRKVQQAQVSEICVKLCSLILEGQSDLRDIYSIGLKTLIADVPEAMGELVVGRLTARLTFGIKSTQDDVQRECLDNMTDLLKRFGHLMKSDHEKILTPVIVSLDSNKAVIRKRASVCLGALAVVSSDHLLFQLVEDLLRRLEGAGSASPSSDEMATIIRTVGTVSRTVGYRLGRCLDQLVPIFLRCCGDPDDESMHTAAGNDLREHCFPGLESFVLRCPREVTPHVAAIMNVAVTFMKFDPNYCYDDDEDEGGARSGDDEVEDYGDDEDDYDADDDDTSWKVRKAAMKVLRAIIQARSEVLQPATYEALSNELLARVKEREETVRLEVLGCLTALLEVTLVRSGGSGCQRSPAQLPPIPQLTIQRSGSGTHSPRSGELLRTAQASTQEVPEGVLEYVQGKVPVIIRLMKRQLTGQSVKSKNCAFVLLDVLVKLLQGSLEDFLPEVLAEVVKFMATDKNEGAKLDALHFLHTAMAHHRASAVQPVIAQTLPTVIASSRDDWYKIAAAALRILGVIIDISRPDVHLLDFTTSAHSSSDALEMEDGTPASDFNYAPLVPIFYSAVLPRLEAPDIDHEIKESSIYCAAKIVSVFGDVMNPSDRETILMHLSRRLDNEVTRVPALKAFTSIASTSLQLDVSAALSTVAADIAVFLRQSSRVLKQTTLITLQAIISSSSARHTTISSSTVRTVLTEVSQLLTDSDLNITDLSLRVTYSALSLFHHDKEVTPVILVEVLAKVVSLACSPLVQGHAQTSLIELLQLMVRSSLPDLSFENLRDRLVSFATPSAPGTGLPKQGVSNLAQCIAGICLAASVDARNRAVAGFLVDLRGSNEDMKHLSLLCMGHLGQEIELSAAEGAADLKEVIVMCFESGCEDTKAATAFALGHLAVGSMNTYLPVILDAVESSKHQYLLLSALKETIVVHVKKGLDFQPYLGTVLPGLMQLMASDEEGVRSMVAECLGALASAYSDSILHMLQASVQSHADDQRVVCTVVTSLRFFFARYHPSTTSRDNVVSPDQLAFFLSFLADESMEVRRAALHMTNAAVHYNAPLVVDMIEGAIVPHLLSTLSFKHERVVDLGPFKHKVDDGLPLRKAALTCCETILYVAPDTMDAAGLMAQLIAMAADNKDDTNIQCHQVICKLSECYPGAVLCVIDDLIDPLEKALSSNKAVKEAASSSSVQASAEPTPEAERFTEQVRSIVRLIVAMNKIDDISGKLRWQDFLVRLQKKPLVGDMLAESTRHVHEYGDMVMM